jgi:hypothetical protein
MESHRMIVSGHKVGSHRVASNVLLCMSTVHPAQANALTTRSLRKMDEFPWRAISCKDDKTIGRPP